MPSAALEFSVSPVTAARVGSRLSSSAAILVWSKVRSAFCFTGGGGVAAWACGFGGGFFSSFLIASAIGSGFTGSGFFSTGFSCGFGSSFGWASATRFGGAGVFFYGFCGLGGGGGAGYVA